MQRARHTCQPRMMTASSQSPNGSFLTAGSSWLHQRSRHDLPDRPGMSRAMSVQFPGRPCLCAGTGYLSEVLFLPRYAVRYFG